MATLISKTSGNFTDASTWGLVDTTSAVTSNSGGSLTTTAYVVSSTFTPGAITVDGFALYIGYRAVVPSGTFSAAILQSGSVVSGAEVTINVSDLPQIDSYVAASGGIGWVFFKFSAPVTLAAATAYTIAVKSSVASQVNVRSTFTTNWLRFLRTTTNQAPAAGDTLLIVGQWTAAATVSAITVTMNNTATTAFGQVDVCNNGILTYGTTAATNYYLKTLNTMVRPVGIMHIGTSSTPIPASSTAVLELSSTSGSEFGLIVCPLAIFESYGAAKTSWTNLTVDAAAAATSFTVGSTSGWIAGDEVAFTPTARTIAQFEKLTTLTIPTGTTFTTAASGFAHSGTSPIAGQVGNVTRNIRIRGMTTTLTAYVLVYDSGIFSASYTQFTLMGSATVNRGLISSNITGSFTLNSCSFYDFASSAYGVILNTVGNDNVTVDNCVFYNISTALSVGTATLGSAVEWTNNLSIGGGNGANLSCSDLVFTGNRIAGCSPYGLVISHNDAVSTGTFHSNAINTCQYNVVFDANIFSMTLGSMISYFGTTGNLLFQTTSQIGRGLVFDSWTLFGAAGSRNIQFSIDVEGEITFKNCTINSHAVFTTTNGVDILGAIPIKKLIFVDCSFGNIVPHTQDFIFSIGTMNHEFLFYNSVLASPLHISASSEFGDYGYLASHNHDGVIGAFKTIKRYGILSRDTVIFDSSPASLRITPNNASNKIAGGIFRVGVEAGNSASVSVRVRKSTSLDGVLYNGSQPRLILRLNPLAELNDSVIATATNAANGAFETISGSSSIVANDCILEFTVDCDGTAGWVNVGDFEATSADIDNWENGELSPLTGSGSGSGSTIIIPQRHRKVI